MRIMPVLNIRVKLEHFWNETLGPDISEDVDIEKNGDSELKESLKRVENMETKYEVSSSSNKGGKGNSKVVEEAKVDTTKAIKEANKKAKGKEQVVRVK